MIKRFAAYLVKLRVPRESCWCFFVCLFVCLFFSQIVLTIKTAVKRPSFKDKKKKKKHLKRVNQIEEINGLGSIYVRRRTFQFLYAQW